MQSPAGASSPRRSTAIPCHKRADGKKNNKKYLNITQTEAAGKNRVIIFADKAKEFADALKQALDLVFKNDCGHFNYAKEHH